MENSKQIQKAGDDAQQIQAESVTVNNGFSANDVANIFKALVPMSIQDYTKEAYRIAEERITCFENKLLPRIEEIENAIPMFADPVFQVQLKNAQRSAAVSDRKEDYGLLTELIIAHVEKGANRKNRIGIQKATEIVGMIDNDALCALTVAHAIGSFAPMQGTAKEGLQNLNQLFSRLIYEKLPEGVDWIDHLDVLGTIRINAFGSMKKISEYYTKTLNGYACIGIEKQSDNYKRALDLLANIKLSQEVLINNPFLDGYVCLPIFNKNAIHNMELVNANRTRNLNEKEVNALYSIWDMYDTDDQLQDEVNKKFMDMWDSFESLRTVRVWWEDISRGFSITSVGKVLAHTNAKRCDKRVPDLI